MDATKSANLQTFLQSDGKTVIVPIDHGTAIPTPGLESPGEVITSLSDHADGFVVNMGIARAFASELSGKGVCFRTDVYKPAVDSEKDLGAYVVYGADDASDVGATAMMNMLYPNHPNEAEITRECADVISEGNEVGLPVIVESLPYGLGVPDKYTVANISFAVRAAAELGADVVKTAFPTGATEEQFKEIVDACYVPLVILGGAAMGDDEALLDMVAKAIGAGAAGVAIGRNVWQHPDPPMIAKAIWRIVHDGATAEAALKS